MTDCLCVQVVGTHVGGLAPCILLASRRAGLLQPLYLFNIPTGFSRFALEHRLLRPARGALKAIFATGLSQAHLGGMGALILRSATDGMAPVHVCGPVGTARVLHAHSTLFRWAHPHLLVRERDDVADGAACFEDPHVRVTALRDLAGDAVAALPPAAKRARADAPGASNVAPVFRRDADGQYESLSSAALPPIRPDVVLGYLCQCAAGDALVLVLDVAAPAHVEAVLAHPFLQQSLAAHHGPLVIVHMRLFLEARPVAAGQLDTPSPRMPAFYQRLVAGLPGRARHMYLGSPPPPPDVPPCPLHVRRLPVLHVAAAAQRCHLHALSPQQYPVCPCNATSPTEGAADRILQIYSPQQNSWSEDSLGERWEAAKRAVLPLPDELARRPTPVACSSISGQHDTADANCASDSASESDSSSEGAKAEHMQPRRPFVPAVPNRKLYFLGTGSSEPSKYRNGSAIWLSAGNGDVGVLLDCGEGTWAALVALLGDKGASSTLASLAAVWVSHNHADHCLGLMELIERRGALSMTPLPIIAPQPVIAYLQNTLAATSMAAIPPCCVLFDMTHFDSMAPTFGLKAHLLHVMSLRTWTNVPVEHCRLAFGVALQCQDGRHIVYSGDTRPCARLRAAGTPAALLIHEATFEDEQQGHACSKRHATVSEALQAGVDMAAQTVVLTHFSQRYTAGPSLPADRHPAGPTAIMAFDGLVVEMNLLEAIQGEETVNAWRAGAQQAADLHANGVHSA